MALAGILRFNENASWLNLPGNFFALLAAVAVGALTSCGRSTTAESQSHPPPDLEVQTVHPRRGQITRSITLPGEVKAYQQATLYAKVAGYLKTISVDKGDFVTAGALLAEIEVPELLADVTKYKAEVEVAGLDYQRLSESQKQAPDLVVPQTVDEAKGKLDIAKANLERTETLLNYAKIVARDPAHGRSGRVHSRGDFGQRRPECRPPCLDGFQYRARPGGRAGA